jgi:hypothetical protein
MKISFQNKRVFIIKQGQATRNKNPSRKRCKDILTGKDTIAAVISREGGNLFPMSFAHTRSAVQQKSKSLTHPDKNNICREVS